MCMVKVVRQVATWAKRQLRATRRQMPATTQPLVLTLGLGHICCGMEAQAPGPFTISTQHLQGDEIGLGIGKVGDHA